MVTPREPPLAPNGTLRNAYTTGCAARARVSADGFDIEHVGEAAGFASRGLEREEFGDRLLEGRLLRNHRGVGDDHALETRIDAGLVPCAELRAHGVLPRGDDRTAHLQGFGVADRFLELLGELEKRIAAVGSLPGGGLSRHGARRRARSGCAGDARDLLVGLVRRRLAHLPVLL